MAKRPQVEIQTHIDTTREQASPSLEALANAVRHAAHAHRMALYSHLDALRAHMRTEQALLEAARDSLIRAEPDTD